MAIPNRDSGLPLDASPKTNVIELNTIAGPARRPPYTFKADSQPVQARRKPYVFPEARPDIESLRDVKLFEFLTVSAEPEHAEPRREDPWGSWAKELATEDDPEEVSAMLATLLAKLDQLAEERLRGQRRMLPIWAPLIPPVCILFTLGLGVLALSGLLNGWGLQGLTTVTPLVSGMFAVPLGLLATNLLLGGWLRRTAPGTEVRFGDLTGTVLVVRRLGWVLDLAGLGKRRMPYYVTAFARPERGHVQEPQL